MELDQCLREGFLKQIKPDRQLSEKELDEAEYDLEKAKTELEQQDYKWSIIMSYYSMFHAAKAILFRLGYVEKRHFAISVVLEDLAKKGKIKLQYVNHFKGAMSAREDSNYHYTYPQETAGFELENAESFLEEIKRIINKI